MTTYVKHVIFLFFLLALCGVAYGLFVYQQIELGEKVNHYSLLFIVFSGVIASLLASYLALFFLIPKYSCEKSKCKEILGTGVIKFIPDQNSMNQEEWAKFIEDTPKRGQLYIVGVANSEWLDQTTCAKAFEKIVTKKKAELFIYFLSPDSKWAEAREFADAKNHKGKTRERTNESIKDFISFFSHLSDEEKKRIHLRKYDAMPSNGMIANGKFLIIKNYLSLTANDNTPITIFKIPGLFKTGWKLENYKEENLDEYLDRFFADLEHITKNFHADEKLT